MTPATAPAATTITPLASHGADPLSGRFATPGDATIAQRALILAGLAVGRSSLQGMPQAADVLATAGVLRQLGVRIEQQDSAWQVHGLGVRGLLAPDGPLDCGGSASAASLGMGLLAPYDLTTRFIGDETLAQRPLRPLLEGLGRIGAHEVDARDARLPLKLRGAALPLAVNQTLTSASETIKSALLLAGLQVAGTSVIHETVATPDHSEKLLAAFGADISVTSNEQGGTTIRLTGLPELRAHHIVVPGDPSAAAHAIVAGLMVPGSDLLIEGVLVNPTRTGLIDTLLEMGGDIQFLNQRQTGGEHVADLRVRSSRMKGVRIDGAHAGAMLDDIPALAIAAAFATGETVIEGLDGMRAIGNDRLAALAAGLAANRVTVTEGEGTLAIVGNGKVDGGGVVTSRHDARIAAAFLVMGLGSRQRVTIDDGSALDAELPHFVAAMTAIGGRFPAVKGH